jgi:hypothetical protein
MIQAAEDQKESRNHCVSVNQVSMHPLVDKSALAYHHGSATSCRENLSPGLVCLFGISIMKKQLSSFLDIVCVSWTLVIV